MHTDEEEKGWQRPQARLNYRGWLRCGRESGRGGSRLALLWCRVNVAGAQQQKRWLVNHGPDHSRSHPRLRHSGHSRLPRSCKTIAIVYAHNTKQDVYQSALGSTQSKSNLPVLVESKP